jgi:hypothetical protein
MMRDLTQDFGSMPDLTQGCYRHRSEVAGRISKGQTS